MSLPNKSDVLIIGAGAAGLMCAIVAGQRGRSVAVIDHANKVGKKILMSGGGRCNFTNLHTGPEHFLSQNPAFCKSALARYTPTDFVEMVDRHAIPWHEKKLGQLFCDHKAGDILAMLLAECQQAGVKVHAHCSVEKVTSLDDGFDVKTNLGSLQSQSLVIASGGLSIPKMGASPFGYELAKQFNLAIVPPRAALVPLTLDRNYLDSLSALSGSAQAVSVSCNDMSFNENLLFTHRGLSGPAILQISSYWQAGESISVNLLPDINLYDTLLSSQQARPKAELKTILSSYMSKHIAEVLCNLLFTDLNYGTTPINQFSNKQLQSIAKAFYEWRVRPGGTEGYRTAEVTLGGIDTSELSSKTMQVNKQKGLFFIGEVVDVTGHLGGFNFQWAWASGQAAGNYV